MTDTAVLHTDGGARGNPGPAGIGFVISAGGDVVCEAGAYIGEVTNNIAEYEALIWGLENVRDLGFRRVDVRCDSELVVRQLAGAYRVKQPHLKPLFSRVGELLKTFESSKVSHVRREKNREADALVNAAIDARSQVGEPRCTRGGGSPQGSLF